MNYFYKILSGLFLIWLITYAVFPVSHIYPIVVIFPNWKNNRAPKAIEIAMVVYLFPHIYLAEKSEIYEKWIDYQIKAMKLDD